MQNPKNYLKKTLKNYRREFGLSLDQTAKLTGVSKAMLGQIERGESSPTVATLWKITTGLKVSLSSFLEPAPDIKVGLTLRSADSIRKNPAGEGMLVAPIFPFDKTLGFEFFELTFLPGYERIAEAHQKGVIEQISILTGHMEVLTGGKWHPLTKGQSIRFAGDSEHGYRNNSLKRL